MKRLSLDCNKGISLIVLVITIIVMIILATVIIISIANNNVINKANESVFKTNIKNYMTELSLHITNEIMEGKKPVNIYADNTTSPNIKDIIPSMTNEDSEIFIIEAGILKINYIASDKQKLWASQSGLPQRKMFVANAPLIQSTGLIPIKFNSDGSMTNIDSENNNNEWYEYKVQTSTSETNGDSKWANAKTSDGSMWVWIPRFAYKITYIDPSEIQNGGSIDVVFLEGTTDKYIVDGVRYTAKRVGDSTITSSDYIVHPAFTNESATDYKNGGWDKELTGFWVAKFSAGYAGGNNSVSKISTGLKYTPISTNSNYYGSITAGTTNIYYPVFMPNTFAYNYINIGDMYTLSRKLTLSNNPYNLSDTAIDSHMLKNSEWGAVVYLTHSQYGRNGIEPRINNVNLNNSVFQNSAASGTKGKIYGITGYSGVSDIATEVMTTMSSMTPASLVSASNVYAWNTNVGQLASSTGNMYGVYDLNGGTYEYVAGYIPTDAGDALTDVGASFAKNGSSVISVSTKYSSVYSYNTSTPNDSQSNYIAGNNPLRRGEALWEVVGTQAWNLDSVFFSTSDAPFLIRSGSYNLGADSGLFFADPGDGYSGGYYGFRVVLSSK